MDLHDVGDLIRFSADFYDLAGNLADPSTVELRIRKSDDTVVSLTLEGGGVTKASTGKYRADVSADSEGSWAYRWISTGVAQSAGESSLYVRPTMVP